MPFRGLVMQGLLSYEMGAPVRCGELGVLHSPAWLRNSSRFRGLVMQGLLSYGMDAPTPWKLGVLHSPA